MKRKKRYRYVSAVNTGDLVTIDVFLNGVRQKDGKHNDYTVKRLRDGSFKVMFNRYKLPF